MGSFKSDKEFGLDNIVDINFDEDLEFSAV